MRTKKTLPKGFKCQCGLFHEYDVYVYAHWDIRLTHTCACGRVHEVLQGKATFQYSVRKEKPNQKP